LQVVQFLPEFKSMLFEQFTFELVHCYSGRLGVLALLKLNIR